MCVRSGEVASGRRGRYVALDSSSCAGCTGRCGIRLGTTLRLDGEAHQRLRIAIVEGLEPGDRVSLSFDEARIESLLGQLFFLPIIGATFGFVILSEALGLVVGLLAGIVLAVALARWRTRREKSLVVASVAKVASVVSLDRR